MRLLPPAYGSRHGVAGLQAASGADTPFSTSNLFTPSHRKQSGRGVAAAAACGPDHLRRPAWAATDAHGYLTRVSMVRPAISERRGGARRHRLAAAAALGRRRCAAGGAPVPHQAPHPPVPQAGGASAAHTRAAAAACSIWQRTRQAARSRLGRSRGGGSGAARRRLAARH